MVACLLARLQGFHLLWQNQGIELLLGLFMNLPDFLLALLLGQ